MNDPVQTVLAALRAKGHEARRVDKGWNCRCPAHDDTNPSLSIDQGDGGRALVYCHTGCSVDAVCAAIGLKPADLFAHDPIGNGHEPKPRRRDAGSVSGEDNRGPTFATSNEAIAAIEKLRGTRSATWTYHDSKGGAIELVLRWDHPADLSDPESKATKIYRPVSLSSGRWTHKHLPTPRPLYGLPALLATKPGSRMWICEGEKACDAARAVGLMATTSLMGSNNAKHSDWSPLAGRDIVILPDHDEPGEKYGDDVATRAAVVGAKSIRIVHLADLWPNMPEGGDIADLLERTGGDVDAIKILRGEVEALAVAAVPETIKPQAALNDVYTPFPVRALPQPIRSFVDEAAGSIGCDASYIALPMLAGLASAIGTTTRIQLKSDWTEPAILWCAIIGESGTSKSPAIELALRPIRKRQQAAMKAHSEAMARHKLDVERSGKPKLAVDSSSKPEAPVAERFWTDDATTEALAVLLQQNPRGLLMARDELAGWFGGFDAYKSGKGGDAAKWLEMFGGRTLIVDRKGSASIHVENAAVSIAGGIQPESLRRALGVQNIENGLASRLLLAYPPKLCPGWSELEIDKGTMLLVESVFEELYTLEPDTDDAGDACPRCLPLTADARKTWIDWVNKHAAEALELSGADGFAWSKLKGYAARIALVVHLTRCAAKDSTLIDKNYVDTESIKAGVTLARWFGNEARRVYSVLSETDEGRDSRKLVELIRHKGGSMSCRELVQSTRTYTTVADAEAALSKLVTSGAGSWVTPEQRGRGQPKAKRLELAPLYNVYNYRNTVGGTGSGNSVDVDSLDKSAPTNDDTEWGEI